MSQKLLQPRRQAIRLWKALIALASSTMYECGNDKSERLENLHRLKGYFN